MSTCASQPDAVPPCRGGAMADIAVEVEPVPAWLDNFDSGSAMVIDVRPILAAGREPIADVLAAAESMPRGGGLVILAPFNPAPLRALLHERGFATYGRRLVERRWNIRVVRAAALPVPKPARSGAGLKLGGAAQRLLPEVIPLRFFGVALFAHVVAWAGLMLLAEDIIGFRGGAGPVLGLLHLVALGVLLATAFGASFQMLPVAFALPPPPAWLCDLAFALLVAGAGGLISGFAWIEPRLMVGGALLLVGAVLLHALALARLVWQANDNLLLRCHIGAALVFLALALVLALGLGLDFQLGWLPNHQDAALAHLILAGFGFMALLVMGFSQILIPMFAVAEPTANALALIAFALALLGVTSAAAGALTEFRILLATGLVAGFAAALFHCLQMTLTLKRRLRTRLGPEFVLIGLAWLFCPLVLGLGLALVFEVGGEVMPVLFGVSLIFGWYLTFLLGVLQRILPFLASMHASRLGAKALSPAKLVSAQHLAVHRWCHLSALFLVGAGLILANSWAVRLGGLVGLVGALSFVLFGAEVLKRTRASIVATATLSQ